MLKKRKWRFMSGILAVIICFSTVFNAGITVLGAETSAPEIQTEAQFEEVAEISNNETDSGSKISALPLLAEVKDQLKEEEIVIANDITISLGEKFEVDNDYNHLTFDDEKVKIEFKGIENEEAEEKAVFDYNKEGTYRVIYEVYPLSNNHLAYQISRNIVVEVKDTEVSVNDNNTNDISVQDEESGEDDPESEQQPELVEDAVMQDFSEEAAKGEVIDADSVDTGVFVSVMSRLRTNSSSNVTLVKGKYLKYPSNVGNYSTDIFYVNGKIAYCLESKQPTPADADYVAEILNDNENVQKVLYYGYGGPGDLTGQYMSHLDEDTRYIYTHIAASYAYCGNDGFYGCKMEDLKASGVIAYIDFLFGQENPPTAAINLSSDYEKGYLDGELQRTANFKLTGDHRNFITVSIPAKVTYHNVTDSKEQTGGTIKIYGGTNFHFTAPKTVTGLWKTGKLSGEIGSQWKTLVIKQDSSSQDIGYGEFITENASFVEFSVKWLDLVKISLIKKDATTDANLAGAIFGVYEDAACTKLITKMPATDTNGSSYVELTKSQETVYLREITAPVNYYINTKTHNVKVVAGGNTDVIAKNTEVRAEIKINKIDKETNTFLSQGDGNLAGAEYGLFAAEDIAHPDSKSGILYKKGDMVTKGVINDKGALEFKNLYLGKYIVKETNPGEGYLLDPTEYPITAEYEGQEVKIVRRDATVKETIKKQAFQLIKVGTDGVKTEADLLEGAGFKVYLISALKGVKDGSIKPNSNGSYSPEQFINYDFTKELTALDYSKNSNGVPMDEIFTDSKGYAKSKELAYGTYVVVETTVPKNYNPILPFIVKINEDSREPQQWRVFSDYEYQAFLKIYKTDGTSKLPVLHTGAKFKIYNLDNKEYVMQYTHYPTLVKHTEFTTSDEGYLLTPEKLKAGRYRLEEISAPEGYVKSDPIEITIAFDTACEIEPETGAVIIKLEYENTRQTGALRIQKTGEKLTGYDIKNSKSIFRRLGELLNLLEEQEEVFDFTYEIGNVKGAEFAIYATEDIYTPDYQLDETGSRIIIYNKDELVAKIQSSADGVAQLEEMPLGSYKIVETIAGNGYVLNKEIQEFTLEYAGDEVEIVYHDSEYVNERQKVELTITKMKEGTVELVEGAEFGLYCAEDILALDGSVIVPADTLIETAQSNEMGIVKFLKDLPISHYYVTEIKPAPGFILNEEIIDFNLVYENQENELLSEHAEFKNDYTKVDISKVDIGGEEIVGAKLTLKDQEGNVIESWVSDGDPHRIDCLAPGEYTLIEEQAPEGYEIAEEIIFTVLETGEIQKVTMIDEYEKKGTVSVLKVGDMLIGTTTYDSDYGKIHRMEYEKRYLPGVEFTIYDAEGNAVDTIVTGEDGLGTSKELPLGNYVMKETKTPAGLAMNHKEYKFVLEKGEDNKVVDVSMDIENDVIDTEINVFKVGEMLNPDKGNFAYGEKPLEGVYFGIFTNEDIKDYQGEVALEKDKLIGVIKTNEEGKATLKGALVSGSYYYKELKTLEGYILDEEKHEFELTLENEPITIFDVNKENPLLNKLMKAKVTLTKVDATDVSKKLSGAEFQLFTETGQSIGTYVTDANGEIKVENLAYGEYYFKETKAPSGYQKLGDKISFSMKGQDISITCRNHVIPKLGFEDSMVRAALVFAIVGLATLGTGFFIYYKKKKQKTSNIQK